MHVLPRNLRGEARQRDRSSHEFAATCRMRIRTGEGTALDRALLHRPSPLSPCATAHAKRQAWSRWGSNPLHPVGAIAGERRNTPDGMAQDLPEALRSRPGSGPAPEAFPHTGRRRPGSSQGSQCRVGDPAAAGRRGDARRGGAVPSRRGSRPPPSTGREARGWRYASTWSRTASLDIPRPRQGLGPWPRPRGGQGQGC